MTFKDFLAKQPIDVIVKTEIDNQRVFLPIEVDSKSFSTNFSEEINSNNLTTEKAIYIASMHNKEPLKDYKYLLNSKVHF